MNAWSDPSPNGPSCDRTIDCVSRHSGQRLPLRQAVRLEAACLCITSGTTGVPGAFQAFAEPVVHGLVDRGCARGSDTGVELGAAP